jgi:hypothetical protein
MRILGETVLRHEDPLRALDRLAGGKRVREGLDLLPDRRQLVDSRVDPLDVQRPVLPPRHPHRPAAAALRRKTEEDRLERLDAD